MNEPVIEIRNLFKSYLEGESKFAVLKGIDLEIQKGEFLCLIGSSGSGKSTLMNILGCLDQEYEGFVSFLGHSLKDLNDHQISDMRNRMIGFVFQSFHLIPQLSVIENVELPLFYAGVSKSERRERALVQLEKMKIDHRSHFFPNQISGGERQRCALSRALVHEPSLILADEPTGNLDSTTSEEIMMILEDLNRNGKTILIVTHDQEIAKRLPRVIQMKDGLIRA